jgi:hypothetical protein
MKKKKNPAEAGFKIIELGLLMRTKFYFAVGFKPQRFFATATKQNRTIIVE